MTEKLTKQGVRDLNHLPSKPAGRMVRLGDWHGSHRVCRKTEVTDYGERCTECGRYLVVFEWGGLY